MAAGSDNKAHQKVVKTGIRQGDQVQMLEGLAEGDRVITSGAYGLPDNTKIRIELPQSPARVSPTRARGHLPEKSPRRMPSSAMAASAEQQDIFGKQTDFDEVFAA